MEWQVVIDRARHRKLADRTRLFADYDSLVEGIVKDAQPRDVLVFMSNGGFGGVRQKVTSALQQARDAAVVSPGAARSIT